MTSAVWAPTPATQNSSRWANSIATRAEIVPNAGEDLFDLGGRFFRESGAQIVAADWCSVRSGPILRIIAAAKFAERLRSRRLIAPPTQVPTRSSAAARPRHDRKANLHRRSDGHQSRHASEHDDDLAENLPAFEPREAAFEIRERDLGVDHRRKARRHLGEALADVAYRCAERTDDAILLKIELEQVQRRSIGPTSIRR